MTDNTLLCDALEGLPLMCYSSEATCLLIGQVIYNVDGDMKLLTKFIKKAFDLGMIDHTSDVNSYIAGITFSKKTSHSLLTLGHLSGLKIRVSESFKKKVIHDPTSENFASWIMAVSPVYCVGSVFKCFKDGEYVPFKFYVRKVVTGIYSELVSLHIRSPSPELENAMKKLGESNFFDEILIIIRRHSIGVHNNHNVIQCRRDIYIIRGDEMISRRAVPEDFVFTPLTPDPSNVQIEDMIFLRKFLSQLLPSDEDRNFMLKVIASSLIKNYNTRVVFFNIPHDDKSGLILLKELVESTMNCFCRTRVRFLDGFISEEKLREIPGVKLFFGEKGNLPDYKVKFIPLTAMWKGLEETEETHNDIVCNVYPKLSSKIKYLRNEFMRLLLDYFPIWIREGL